MKRGARGRHFRLVGLVGALAALAALLPATAEAQGRGTLQVTAQVVDPAPGYQGIRAAKAVLAITPASPPNQLDAVSTLAHVSVAYPAERGSAVVVTIDYSRN